MRHNGRELRLQVKTALQNTRIEAAIVDQGGQLVALGESCDPRADWIHMQARIRTQRQQREEKANGQAQTAPASVSQPEHSQKEEKQPESQAEGPSEEMHNTGYTFPLSPGAEGSATLSAQQGDAKWMETVQRKEREEERTTPLIETLLQQAQPMQELPAESDAQTALDVEEISRLIHQELQGQDAEAKEPVIIATEQNAGEKATERLAQQIAEAISEPLQLEEEPLAEEELERGRPGTTVLRGRSKSHDGPRICFRSRGVARIANQRNPHERNTGKPCKRGDTRASFGRGICRPMEMETSRGS